MALPVTSNTASFLVSRDDIIKGALRSLKVLAIGETPQPEDVTNLAFSLNLILKAFNMEGWLRFGYLTINFPFVANQAAYTIAESGGPSYIGFRPVRIGDAWRRDNSTPPVDTPLFPLSRADYDALTIKTQPGQPNQYYYDPLIGLSTITFWPVPQPGTTDTAYLSIQRPIQDITGSTQNFDLEQEWFLPLKWILADEVSHEYEVDAMTIKMVQQRAEYWRGKVADFSTQEGSMTIQPDTQGISSPFDV